MKALALSWIGTRTKAFAGTVAFFRDVLGLRIGNAREGFVRFDLPDGSCLEVFLAGGAEDYVHFTTGPVIGFQVGDFDSAREELRRAGLELLGGPGGDAGKYRWQHFRAPDRSVWEVVDSPSRQPDGSAIGRCRVTRFGWVGLRTPYFGAMRRFALDTLRLPVVREEPGVVTFGFPNGDVLELSRPGGPSNHLHTVTGPMPGLLVESLDLGEGELRAHRVEILARKRHGAAGWTRFRAPDGNVYELRRFDERPSLSAADRLRT